MTDYNPITCNLTPELIRVIDAKRPAGTGRAAFIEGLLWRSPVIKAGAKATGISKPARRRPGRPANQERNH